MNKVISRKEIIRVVCVVLERERNRDSIVFTSARGILRKIKREDLNLKDINMALDYLIGDGKVQVVSKSNRQTVLRLKENLFDINLDEIKEEYEEEKELVFKITPKRLLEIFEEKALDGIVEVPCKEVVDIFGCTFTQVQASLKLIKKNYGVDVTFDKGILKADLNTKQVLSVDSKDDLSNSEDDTVFDQIGESLESVFDELKKLRAENTELKSKVDRLEISNKRLNEEINEWTARCESLDARNRRLYNMLVDSTNNRD